MVTALEDGLQQGYTPTHVLLKLNSSVMADATPLQCSYTFGIVDMTFVALDIHCRLYKRLFIYEHCSKLFQSIQ